MYRYENPEQFDNKETKKTTDAVRLLFNSRNLFYLSDKPNILRLINVYKKKDLKVEIKKSINEIIMKLSQNILFRKIMLSKSIVPVLIEMAFNENDQLQMDMIKALI